MGVKREIHLFVCSQTHSFHRNSTSFYLLLTLHPLVMFGSAVIVARGVYLSKKKCLGIKRKPHGAFLNHLDFIDPNGQPIYELWPN